MGKTYTNLCIRCGTQRIVHRTWKEKIENSVIINTEMICPNPACQKQVEKDNQKSADKYSAMKKKNAERAEERKVAMHARKAKKLQDSLSS